VAGKVGAQVDLARKRHGEFTVPLPHLYFARSDCGRRGPSYVYVHPPREVSGPRTPAASAGPAGTSPSPQSPSPP
jgi:hypothetical protein